MKRATPSPVMTKSMKRALAVLFVLVPALAVAQDYEMYETQYLAVRSGHSKQFNAGIKAHNDRFHASGPYRATVWYVIDGPKSGQMFWVMGPCTFTDLDGRPAGEDHESDWAENVLAHAEQGETQYWRLDPDLSYRPDTRVRPKSRVSIHDVERNEGYRYRELRRKVKQVQEAKKYPDPVLVFRGVGQSATGRDFAVVRAFDKWAALDRDGTFAADFEEVHGSGSWVRFLREAEEAIGSRQTELHELLPDLSAPPPAASE
jgi:hypothetical protein